MGGCGPEGCITGAGDKRINLPNWKYREHKVAAPDRQFEIRQTTRTTVRGRTTQVPPHRAKVQ